MTIRLLQIFQMVCIEGGITKAAQKLYMTQPAVSRAISDLEEELHTVLFDRISRRMTLNQAGRLLFDKVERLLPLYDELEQGACFLEEQAPLRVGSSITIANFWLPSLLREYESLCPQTPVEITIDRARSVTDKLLQNELDAALIEGVVSDPRLEVFSFSTYRLVTICPPEHPLAGKGFASLEIFLAEPLLLREKGSAIRDTFDSALFLRGLSVTPVWTSVNSQALIQGVKSGFGVSILPDILVRKELESGELHELKVAELDLKNENHLVLLRQKHRSRTLQALIQMIEKRSK